MAIMPIARLKNGSGVGAIEVQFWFTVLEIRMKDSDSHRIAILT
jgi:hypothetical protein